LSWPRVSSSLEAAASPENPARIINVGSVYGETTDVLTAYSYTASKAAIHQITRVLAHELASETSCATPWHRAFSHPR
jgi:NAD(P)-dependent dehydrogenase (short-subunit alcohol dehydrogenase family)